MTAERPRSPEWPRVERLHLQRQPRCMCCKPGANTRAGLQVHHIFPFHYCIALGRPDLELDDRKGGAAPRRCRYIPHPTLSTKSVPTSCDCVTPKSLRSHRCSVRGARTVAVSRRPIVPCVT
jgi:hypothetical protein